MISKFKAYAVYLKKCNLYTRVRRKSRFCITGAPCRTQRYLNYKYTGVYCLIFVIFFCNCANSENKEQIYPKVNVDINKLKYHVEYLSTITPPRNYNNINSLNKAAEYIYNSFKELGYNPLDQPFKVNGIEYKNVIASIGPKDSKRLVIGAHYDVFGNNQGADDNASGVSGLLEIARLLKKENVVLKHRVDLVAYTLEEPPFFRTSNMGSYVHAKFLKDNKVELIGMICFEMIGYFTDKAKSQEYPLSIMKLSYPTTGNFIAVVGNYSSSSLVDALKKSLEKTEVDVKTLTAPSFISGVDFSDHLNYWKYDFEAVMITDTAFYRNHNYHKKTDTPKTLNYKKMAEVIKGVFWTILNI